MILKAGFHFSVSFLSPFFLLQRFFFFFSFFCCFTKMTRVFPQLQTCFQFFLFVYLFMYFYSPATALSSWSLSSLSNSQASLEKTLRLGRNCLLRSRYIGYEAPSFLPGVLHHHSQFNTSKVIETSEAHPTLATPARNRSSCRHFSFPWCTPYVNVKLSGACAELKITYQLYGLSIRNPIRKVRIAEPLCCGHQHHGYE